MNFFMEKCLNKLKKELQERICQYDFIEETVDILEFYRNNSNQLWEQVKDLHEILNGIVKVLQNLHQNKQN